MGSFTLPAFPSQYFPRLIQFFVSLVVSFSFMFLLFEINEPIVKWFYELERSHEARYQNVVEITVAYSLPNCLYVCKYCRQKCGILTSTQAWWLLITLRAYCGEFFDTYQTCQHRSIPAPHPVYGLICFLSNDYTILIINLPKLDISLYNQHH